ncbi:hypothetical protein TCE0_060r18766 [Talaromyces pinophilus]|uniref:Uncharacterized protein n=1 Tax=Talaromyces pinophilus TaxID=128442 RepID=A0A6V8HNX8_TALPI|nr:hypothetical protein TCE0_060r18766 [Talaromyces pinophilus]
MSPSQNDVAKHFRALHNPQDPLILTNVYDASTASVIASLPTARALATASFAIAASIGVDDENLTKDQNLAALKTIVSTAHRVNAALPITVDLQDGYGKDLPSLAATIKEVIAIGAVGCNMEDMDNATGTLRPLDEAVARVRTVVEAAKEAGVPDFVLNARTDVLFQEGATLDDAIARGKAFLEAGACTVFVWGGPQGRGVSKEEVEVLVKELEGMVNVKMTLQEGFLGVQEIRRLGVARFDDVPTDVITGIGTISTYSYNNFCGFTTVNTIAAASLGSISIHDADRASSKPNALFSTSVRHGRKARSRWVADTAKLHSAGHSGFFNLNGLYIEPLGEVPRGLIFEIVAWEIRDSEAQNVYNTWIAYTKEGYQDMQYYDLTMFGGSWGRKVNIVEIFTWVPDEDQKEPDWAFCLDDLDIEFLDRRLDE